MKKKETPLGRVRRARRISRALNRAYPNARCALNFSTPLELLVATILSAQCTDVRVNEVTPALFARFPTAADYAAASEEEVQEYIRSTGFYRNKAKNLVALGQELEEKYDGNVPDNLNDLVALPGVGRKTANVVLGNAFGVPGLTVDTHFGRLVRRMGLTEATDPERVEREMQVLIEPRRWTQFSHEIIYHGRQVCHSRKAACGACFIAKDCWGFGEYGPTEPEEAAKLIKGEDRDRLIELALGPDSEDEGRNPGSGSVGAASGGNSA